MVNVCVSWDTKVVGRYLLPEAEVVETPGKKFQSEKSSPSVRELAVIAAAPHCAMYRKNKMNTAILLLELVQF